MLLVQSRYNVLVPLRRGRTLAYNSLTAASAIWEAEETASFQQAATGGERDPHEPTIANLLYGGFLVPAEADELEILRQQYEQTRNDPSKMVLTVAPTLVCNFGCDYCFQGADKPAGSMSAEVQDATVAMVERAVRAIRRLHVAWYGGEPLLAQPVVAALSDRFMAVCTANNVAYDAMMVTNGYGLTPTVARMLLDRQVKSVQVTLDGAVVDHDRRRMRLGGGGTYQRIVENMQAVIEQVPLHISVRINIDARNAAALYALLDDLAARGFARRKNFGVYFAPVEAITEGCHSVADACMSKHEYGQLETALARYAFDAGLAALPYPPRFRGVCGALKPKGFVVIPNGDIHKCWDTVSMPHHRVGAVFDLDALRSDERVLRWSRWTPFENPICRTCKILPNCSGACAHKFLNPDQTLGEAAALPCPSWRYNIKERLIVRAERSGALTADDYDAAQIATDSREVCPGEETHAPAPHARPRRLRLASDAVAIDDR